MTEIKDYIDVTDDEAIAEFRACMDKAKKIVKEKGWEYVELDHWHSHYIDQLLSKLSEEIESCIEIKEE